MISAVDGRIVTGGWPLSKEGYGQYEQVHSSYEPEGWICGRVTMEHLAAGTRSDADVTCEYEGPEREDFASPGAHGSFAIALDPRGKLLWDSGNLQGDHVVAVLTHRVADEYLALLRERGVSYLLAGTEEVDLALALEKIGARLGVRTLMLEGGGGINGSFLRAGLIDELSLLLAPVADGRSGTPTVFDVPGEEAGSAPASPGERGTPSGRCPLAPLPDHCARGRGRQRVRVRTRGGTGSAPGY
jgi:dihydrofolate reductase